MNPPSDNSVPRIARAPIPGARAPVPGARAPIPGVRAPMPDASAAAPRPIAPLDGLVEAAGVERLRGFSLRRLFSEVFRRHTDEELEEYFSGGYPSTTPPPSDVSSSWPAPWVFSRLLVAALLVYFGFDFGLDHFENPYLVPGFIMVGSFAIPVATLVFFLEVNVWRNMSLYQIVRLVFLGGVLSLLVSLFFFDTSLSGFLHESMGASCAGVVEEVGKLVALVCIVRSPRYGRKLDGLLAGAAIGTGFAAFESAGYAFWALLSSGGALAACRSVIVVRGLLSPFGHIVWTAIAGAALWRVKGGDPFRPSMLVRGRFLRLFAVPVLLHMLWNAQWNPPFFLKYVAIGIVDWAFVFALVQEGLKEVREEGASRAARRAALGATTAGRIRFAGAAWAVLAFAIATFFTGFFLSAGGLFFSRVVGPFLGL